MRDKSCLTNEEETLTLILPLTEWDYVNQRAANLGCNAETFIALLLKKEHERDNSYTRS